MNFSFSNLIAQLTELLLTPNEFWKREKELNSETRTLWLTFLLPMILAVAVAVFVGEFFQRIDFFIEYPLLKALREVVLFTLMYFLGVIITNELMQSFGTEKNIHAARKLVVYSMTPLVLISVLTGLFPFLYVLDIVGLYSFYVFWVGAKEMLSFPDNKENSYILSAMVANFFVFSFLSILLSKLLNAYY